FPAVPPRVAEEPEAKEEVSRRFRRFLLEPRRNPRPTRRFTDASSYSSSSRGETAGNQEDPPRLKDGPPRLRRMRRGRGGASPLGGEPSSIAGESSDLRRVRLASRRIP